MKMMIEKITPAILSSRKIKVSMDDGHKLVVNPHIVIRKKAGTIILKSMLDNGDCLDIPLKRIKGVSILSDGFAVDTACLSFDYDEYELVFPRKEDWLQLRG